MNEILSLANQLPLQANIGLALIGVATIGESISAVARVQNAFARTNPRLLQFGGILAGMVIGGAAHELRKIAPVFIDVAKVSYLAARVIGAASLLSICAEKALDAINDFIVSDINL